MARANMATENETQLFTIETVVPETIRDPSEKIPFSMLAGILSIVGETLGLTVGRLTTVEGNN